MKYFKLFFSLIFVIVITTSISNAQWAAKYVTQDDTPNGTGYNTPSIAVFGEDAFVALVNSLPGWDTVRANYLVGYRNASYSTGRLGTYAYGSAQIGNYWKWGTGADTVRMRNAFKIVASPKDSLVYVANNDKDHSILTFKFTKDSVVPAPYRMKTGSKRIWALDIDDNGKIYVVVDSATAAVEADVMIFESIKKEAKWATTHDAAPIKTMDLPLGQYKGVAVDGSGKYLFVSCFSTKKVIKYVGSPTTGYTADGNFKFALTRADSIPGNKDTLTACPMGLSYMRTHNILLVACDTFYSNGKNFSRAYSYSRIYLVDPMSGKLAGDVAGDPNMNVIDQAKWNYDQSNGSYSTQGETFSGYGSTFDAGYDDQGNVYSQSFYSWTVEKWNYFPILTPLTKVKALPGKAESYSLNQNYPNPFNPSTKIEFAIPRAGNTSLKIYNTLGQEILTVLDEFKEAGKYVATFNATKLSSGNYIYVLRSGDFVKTMKMVLVK